MMESSESARVEPSASPKVAPHPINQFMEPVARNSQSSNFKDFSDVTESCGRGVNRSKVIHDRSRSGSQRGGEVSRVDFALGIDDILEQILCSVDRVSLFECRLVSHRWREVSTKILKREDIRIIFNYNPMHKAYIKEWGSQNETLEELTSFLNKTFTKTGHWNKNTFPCNKLHFSGGSLSDSHLQNFLNTYREQVQKIYLDFRDIFQNQSESVVRKQIENLLLYQTVNLQELIFCNDSTIPAINNEDEEDNAVINSALLEHDPEFKKIKLEQNIRLTKLSIAGAVSRKIFDRIISISPNLNQIAVPFDALSLLLQPVSRLHFVREFNIVYQHGTNIWNSEYLKIIEAAILVSPKERQQSQNPPLVKFTKLKIEFGSHLAHHLAMNEDIRSCFVSLINKVLESSWDTLKFISLENYTADTFNGIKWPHLLPEVSKLIVRPKNGCALKIFPLKENFNMVDTLPKIKSIVFNDDIKNASEEGISKNYQFGPVPSVKYANMYVNLDPYIAKLLPARHKNEIQKDYYELMCKLFPSAVKEVMVKGRAREW